MTDFTAPKVRRGRMTNFRTGRFLTFVYNPPSIEEKKSANLVIDAIPGDGDPLVRWASGGPNHIRMDLNVDGDGRLRRGGAQLFNGAKGVNEFPISDASKTYSIAGEIEFFEQFLHPVSQNVRGGTGAPDDIIFTMGRRYQGVRCTMVDVDIRIIEFDSELNPSKAHIKIAMVRRNIRSRTSGDIWDIPEALGIGQQAEAAFPDGLPGSGGKQ